MLEYESYPHTFSPIFSYILKLLFYLKKIIEQQSKTIKELTTKNQKLLDEIERLNNN